MSPDERKFAETVFGGSLPSNDRIILTNLEGLNGRKFVAPNPAGQALVNLGNAYDNPMEFHDEAYPSKGKVFIHELTHAWQIHHSSFVPGLVCEGIFNQLTGADIKPGPGGKNWSEYNLEQQATIVDEWFVPSERGPLPQFANMRPEHPFYRYVIEDIRGGRLLPQHTSSNAPSRNSDHVDVFWVGSDGAIGTAWWDAHLNNGNWNPPFPITPPPGASPPSIFCRLCKSSSRSY